MLRKFSLAAMGCLALLALGATAPSAFAAHQECNPASGALPAGIYPPSNPVASAKGTYDIANTAQFGAGQKFAVDGLDGGAILCNGGSPTGAAQTLSGVIRTPGAGEQIHCASPFFTTCPAVMGGGSPIPDGSYYGNALVDAVCKASSLVCLFGTVQFHGTPATVRVNYNDPNCTNGAVACSTATASPVVGVTCTASTIVRRAGLNTATQSYNSTTGQIGRPGVVGTTYTLEIGQPNCVDPLGLLNLNPTYFTAIKSLTLCDYHGAVGGNSCGDGSQSNTWQQRNGTKGTHNYKLTTQTINMAGQTANGFLTWT